MRSKPETGRFGIAAVMVFRLALPGYHYEFPKDHFNHPDFQTEWWYYTGNLKTAEGRKFGFELTFFRQGVNRERPRNVWDVEDAWLAHLALSDIGGQKFLHTERLNRSAAGLAGADFARAKVWNGNWSVTSRLDAGAAGGIAAQELDAVAEQFRLRLELRPEKAPVIHGRNGVSQKSAGEGHASHYVSYTRLGAKGTVQLDGVDYRVDGLAWMDHEFFTRQLSGEQTGWDWLSLQFDDGSDLMLFELRRKDGSVDPYSAGTYVDARGAVRMLKREDFTLNPGRVWTSRETRAKYPVEWKVKAPGLALEATIAAALDEQEMTAPKGLGNSYWEGAVNIRGTKQGRAAGGAGYLEMTGYAGPVEMGGS